MGSRNYDYDSIVQELMHGKEIKIINNEYGKKAIGIKKINNFECICYLDKNNEWKPVGCTDLFEIANSIQSGEYELE